MASKQLTCAGCLKIVKSKQLLKCSCCSKAYDLLCAGVSEKRYHSFYTVSGSENKPAWNCPECVNKKPKGDTTNTPVRREISQVTYTVPGEQRNDSPPDSVTFRSNRNANTDFDLTNTIRNEIRAAIRAEMGPINEKLLELQNAIQYISNQYDDLTKTTNTIMQDYKNIKSECEQLRSTVSTMSERVNTLEQYLRESNLEIQGVPEHKNENVINIINKIANVVSHKLNDVDVLNCTRVARKNKESDKPRAIVVQLRSTRCRDEFYSAVTRYNKSHPNNKLGSSVMDFSGPNSPIYVSEHLSPANKSLHAAARLKAKELAYKFVWVRNGRIFIRKNETSPFIHVRSQQILDSLH